MAVAPELTQSKSPELGEQFTTFEAKCKSEFDDNGWNAFTDKINEYINDLYVGTRRECIARCNNEVTLKYSGKNAERASMRIDFQRLYGRKQKRYSLQIGRWSAAFSLVSMQIGLLQISVLQNPQRTVGELRKNAEKAEKIRLVQTESDRAQQKIQCRKEREAYLKNLSKDFQKVWQSVRQDVKPGYRRKNEAGV